MNKAPGLISVSFVCTHIHRHGCKHAGWGATYAQASSLASSVCLYVCVCVCVYTVAEGASTATEGSESDATAITTVSQLLSGVGLLLSDDEDEMVGYEINESESEGA